MDLDESTEGAVAKFADDMKVRRSTVLRQENCLAKDEMLLG